MEFINPVKGAMTNETIEKIVTTTINIATINNIEETNIATEMRIIATNKQTIIAIKAHYQSALDELIHLPFVI